MRNDYLPVSKLRDYHINAIISDVCLDADEELFVKVVEKGASYKDQDDNELFKTHIVIGHFLVVNKKSGETVGSFIQSLYPFRLHTETDRAMLDEALDEIGPNRIDSSNTEA